MSELLKREEVLKERISTSNRSFFNSVVNYMVERRVLQRSADGSVSLKSSMETLIVFEASIIWPLVDSYYITLLYTLSLLKNKNVESKLINKRVQWLGESLFQDKTLFFFESCNQESIKNAVNTLLEMKVLQRNSVFLILHPDYQDNENKLEGLLFKISSFRMQTTTSKILNAADNIT